MLTAARSRTREPQDRRAGRFDGFALALLLGGALLLGVSFYVSTWFTLSMPEGGESHVPFGAVSDLYYTEPAQGFATVYFGWLAYALALTSFAAVLVAFAADRKQLALRAAGAVSAIGAGGLAFLAIRVNGGRSYGAWFDDLGSGLYFLVAGFVLIAVSAAVGPRQRHQG